MKKLYLLQGIIFQNGHVLGIGQMPGIGSAVTINKALIYAVFNGIVGPSVPKGNYTGHMNDKWGESGISDFQISDTELTFSKHYKNRPPIHYLFNKKDGHIWLGGYVGADCGRGDSKLIITEIEESFFELT
jgi:hypothetical protein